MISAAAEHQANTAPAGERIYAQRYCTEASPQTVGFIDFVVDAEDHGHFMVRVPQGTKRFVSLADAESWMQDRIKGGARLVKG